MASSIRAIQVSVPITDVATAQSIYVPVTRDMAGKISQVRTSIAGAISNSNVNGLVVVSTNKETLGTITIQGSGSAAGDIDVLNVTSPTAGYVVEGDYILIANGGEATTTAGGLAIIEILK